jgi:hypothetical protein
MHINFVNPIEQLWIQLYEFQLWSVYHHSFLGGLSLNKSVYEKSVFFKHIILSNKTIKQLRQYELMFLLKGQVDQVTFCNN